MGNDASKNLKRSLTMRRGGRGEIPDEYSAIDIRERYERMPKVGSQERMIIKSSWKVIQRNVIQKVIIRSHSHTGFKFVDIIGRQSIQCNEYTNFYFQRGLDFFINTFDMQFKPPLGVTPVFRDHGEKLMQVVTEGIGYLKYILISRT